MKDNFMYQHWKSKMAIMQEGTEPLPPCDRCGMHMPVARIFKHRKSDKCHKATERRLRRRDMEMAERCGEMDFSLEGGEGEERVDNVTRFRYLGRPLDQTDDDWTDVWRNIMRTRLVWGRLGTLLRREGADPRVAEMFYRAVDQAILLYGSETWVISAAMERKVEGTHIGLLRQITGKRARRLGDGTWETPGAEEVREVAQTQSAMTYIGRRQATVAQWVALRPLFGVFAREKGYEEGGSRREAWWRQEATEKNFGHPGRNLTGG